MRVIKFLLALCIIANAIYGLYLLNANANYILADYIWLIRGFGDIDYQDFGNPTVIGSLALLIAQSGIIILLWLVFLAGRWLWQSLAILRSTALVAKPHHMSQSLYAKYKEAVTIGSTSKAGSILLLRSFLEAMIHECFHQERSTFFNSIGKLKKSGQITKEEAQLLHGLRKMGNITSHQRQLSSQDIDDKDMKAILGSTERLMQSWYSRKEDGQAVMNIERKYKPRKTRTPVIADDDVIPEIEETKPEVPVDNPTEDKPSG